MNRTSGNNLSAHLAIIRDLYKSIKQVTEKLLRDFSDTNLIETVQIRAGLLEKIAAEEALTKSVPENDTTSCECVKIKNEIRDLILSIAAIDKTATSITKTSMKQIRSNLCRLYSSSQAAMAYTVQQRS